MVAEYENQPKTSMSHPSPKFSVIIPVYNGERHLRKALESVFSQTVEDFEVVIVDDMSQDGSIDIIEQFSENDNVHLLRNSENQGIAKTMNSAVDCASGKYLAFLDQDDFWHPEKLAKHSHYHNVGEAEIFYSDMTLISSTGESIKYDELPDVPPTGKPLIKYLFREGNFTPFSNVTLPISIWYQASGLDPSLRLAPDYDLWLRLADTYEFKRIPEPLVSKRVHDDQYSNNYVIEYQDINTIVSKMIIKYPYLRSLKRDKIKEYAFKTAHRSYLQNELNRSLRYDMRCIMNGGTWKSILLLILIVLDLATWKVRAGRKLYTLRQKYG